MKREQLEQLSKEELIDRFLELQSKLGLPRKTSKTSSLPPSTDKKAKRANSKPGGAKPGHKAFHRSISLNPDESVDHAPEACRRCGVAFSGDEVQDVIKTYEQIDIPPITPHIVHHRRLACVCAGCGARTKADAPAAAIGSPFGPGIASMAVYLKHFQLFSFERLQGAFKDIFALKISEGALSNLLARSAKAFTPGYEAALTSLRQATAVASDETGLRIEGANAWRWVFRSSDAVVHVADYSRAARVVDETMNGHCPDYWLSDRYASQQNKGKRHQTCLAHLARDIARIGQVGDRKLARKLKAWMDEVFALSKQISTLTRKAIDERTQALQARVDTLLKWNDPCPETWKVVSKMKNASDQLLTFTSAPHLVEPTNNACERELRPSVIQNKVTNGHRSKWGADDDCKIKTVVNTAKLRGQNPYHTIRTTLGA